MILKKLHSRIDLSCCPTCNQINVSRDNILQGSLQAFKRRRFNPEARLDVIFVDSDGVGEGAVDEGGPTREFLRLLMREIQMSKIFEGPEDNRLLALDTHALENGLYMNIAKMIAVSIIHGGVGPHFFSDRLFMQLCSKSTPPVSFQEIADSCFRDKLLKIKEADSVEKANSAISNACDCLNMLGALRFISSLEERDCLVQSAAEYFVNGRTNLALRQFEEGFKTFGLLDELKKNPGIFEDLFINGVTPLEAKDLSTLFEVDFSPVGSNKRRLENKTICFRRDWLIDVEEGDCNPLTLEMVLEFASGASSVPPLGFPHQPKIEFLHTFGQETRIFPEANTCLIVLRLPIHSTYEHFRTYMTEGILQSPTFGTM
ncbi:G2/M phase-specific E3 ubiquitin-protein ligase [Megalobrama amblycephala]|uniref:G2/M phase-specific E3 ubiquitin-protein ligase n=1 Tax=Megalobrama amblycephala TaxID=75352 RepID=UPI0020144196|nr:G2/M phase-specific E3 ubiquitin-protein ligase [Megalobrama amblycephala]